MRFSVGNVVRVITVVTTLVAAQVSHAEYGYFNDVKSGSDIVMKELRWPYWNSAYYNTWWSDYWRSSEGASGYFYNGLGLPAADSPDPVGTAQTLNFSFWPLSNPVNISDTITPAYTSPNSFAMPTIVEGTLARAPGRWRSWQTNVWYRMVIRTWRPVDGTPHRGYAGSWMRDPVSGVWHHMVTVQLPFAVTGIGGSMSFQENFTGGLSPQRTDYRRSYYRYNGTWRSSTNWHAVNHAGAVENVGLIEGNSAVYYETCKSNDVYTGTLTNVWQESPTLTLTQPATPPLDPILVTNTSAVSHPGQLLVQWWTLPNSSPQFAYQVDVFTNAAFTGPVVASAYDIAPEAQQVLLDIGNVATPFARLTIIDLMNQTNPPIAITPTNAVLSAASSVPGAVNGLNYACYHSASHHTTDANTNGSVLPNFAALTPVSSGAVSGLDLTPRQRRNGYAFNFNGYLNVASNGLYPFTLNSCDGSRLLVDGQTVIDWDGKHSASDKSGWIALQAGLHAVNVEYFFDTQPTSLFSSGYFDSFSLVYEGPGFGQTVVPVTAFYRVPGASEPLMTLTTPTNGATISGGNVPLTASVSANGNALTKVQFYSDNYLWAQDASAPFSVNSFFWANTSNALRARLFYNGTNTVDSSVTFVTTTNGALSPWQFTQAFYHYQPTGAAIQGGTFSLIGDGVDLLTRQVTGDCTLVARLASITSTASAPDGSAADTGWQAGIILRGNTNMTPGYPWGHTNTAPFTAVFGSVGGGAYYQDESMVNGGGGYSSGNLGGRKWFKLQRTGNTFVSSVSSDGSVWTAVRTNTLNDFPATIHAGLFTYAGPSSNPNVHRASFDNVSLVGNVVGPPGAGVSPANKRVYVGQSAMFTALPSGNPPFSYQWQFNNLNLPGATNATLSLGNSQSAKSGAYSVLISNVTGVASATALLTVLMPSSGTAAILSNNPVAYWRLNESVGPTASDTIGGFDGTGEGGILFGVPGVTNAPFIGFEVANLAAQFNGVDSDIALPALDLNTNTVTLCAWVKLASLQSNSTGVVFCRSGSTTAGLVLSSANHLKYNWNNNPGAYNWDSGLVVPTNCWAFIALAVSPSNAVVYVATNGLLLAATNAIANANQSFAGTTYLGYDPNQSMRRVNGVIDEAAIFNCTLTAFESGQLVTASATATRPSLSGDLLSTGELRLTMCSGNIGQPYRLLTTGDLLAPLANWLVRATGVFGEAPAHQAVDAAALPAGYFRLAAP